MSLCCSCFLLRHPAAWLENPGNLGQHGGVIEQGPPGLGQAETALTQRDDRVEACIADRQAAGIAAHCGRSGQAHESGGDVDAHRVEPAPAQCGQVPTGATTHIQHTRRWLFRRVGRAGTDAEDPDQKVDFLLGPLGEGVPQIGRAEMLSDRLEPVSTHRRTITVSDSISQPS